MITPLQGSLFEADYGTGSQIEDNTEITTTILYMSTTELKEFKKLAKAGVKKEFGEEFQQKGNLTDLLLKMLRRDYGSTEDNS